MINLKNDVCMRDAFQINLNLIYVASDVIAAFKSQVPATLLEIQSISNFFEEAQDDKLFQKF